jgi:hypothetical protein
MFEELLARWPDLSPAGDPEPLLSPLMNGWVDLPVHLAAQDLGNATPMPPSPQ